MRARAACMCACRVARERAPARVYTLLSFPRLFYSFGLSVPPTLSLSICTRSSFSCSFPPRRSSYPSLASLVFNTSVCRPPARGCVFARALACACVRACVAPVMYAEERPCAARKRERVRGGESERASVRACENERVYMRPFTCVRIARVRMHLSIRMYTSVRSGLSSCRALCACMRPSVYMRACVRASVRARPG